MLYAFELPDGTKTQLELSSVDATDYKIRQLLPKARRGETESIHVRVYKIEVKNLKVELNYFKSMWVTPFEKEMDSTEYHEEMGRLLEEIPEEFRGYVSSEAYDRGHSSGYEESFNIAQDITSTLKRCIDKYTKRLTGA